jgi:hypothetical protein
MSGVLRLSNNVTGRSTINASASNDQTYTLPALGGTLVTGGASSELIFPPGTEALPGLHVQGDVDTGLYAPAANTLGISTAGSERLRIDSSGNVGIGTSSPTQKLHVIGNTILEANNSYVGLQNASGTSTGYMQGQSGFLAIAGGAGSSNTIAFFPGASEALRIDSSGKVGIGTTSPGYLLDVSSVQGDGIRIGSNSAGLITRESEGLRITGASTNKNISFVTAGSEAMRVDTSGRLLVGTSSWTGGALAAFVGNSSVASGNGVVHISRGRSAIGMSSGDAIGGLYFSDNAGNMFGEIVSFIDGAPGSGDYPGRLVFSTTADGASSPTERLRIDSSGNVGIGDSSPDRKLQVINSTDALMRLGRSDASSHGSTDVEIKFAKDYYSNAVFEAASHRFEIQGTEKMRIDSSGTLLMGDPITNGGFNAFVADNGTTQQRGRFLVRAKSTTGGTQEIFQLYTGSTQKLLMRADGNLYNASGGIGVLSDLKLKENIVSANSQWDDIKAIQIRNFNFKEETGHATHTMLGVVAQEVETVSPGLVSDQPDKDEDGNELGTVTKVVTSSLLYMKAVKALQEAMTRIENLEQRLSDAGIA